MSRPAERGADADAAPGGEKEAGEGVRRMDSWDSGSVASSSNGTGTVASGTLRLAVTPVWKLTVSVSIPALFGQALTNLAGLNDYSLLSYYTGREALALMAAYVPLIHFLAVRPVTAMASATSQFITRALGQNGVVMANVYLAHFLFVAICWCLICMLATLTWLPTLNNLLSGARQNYDKAAGQSYLMTMLVGSSLVATFNQAVNPLLLAEGRSFLAMNREVFWAALRLCLTSLLMALVDIKHGNPPGVAFPTSDMQYVAIGTVVAGAVISVWMILILLRRSILDIPLKGCLKFSIKRLFPLNPAIILRILLFGATEWLLTAQAPLTLCILNIVVDNIFTDKDILINHRIQHYLYYQMYLLIGTFTTAFTDGFAGALTYNLGVKKFKRIKSLFLQVFIWETAGTAVLSIIVLAAARPIARFLNPSSLTTDQDLYDEMLDLGTYALRMSAAVQPFMAGYHISCAAANSEGRAWTMVCLVLARFLPLIVLLVVVALRNGDEANFVMILPLAESCPAAAGLLTFTYYVLKYNYLSAFDVDAGADAEGDAAGEEDGYYASGEIQDAELAARDEIAGLTGRSGPSADAPPVSDSWAARPPRAGGERGAGASGGPGGRAKAAPAPLYQGDIVLTKVPRRPAGSPRGGPAGGPPEEFAVAGGPGAPGGGADDAVSPAPSRAHVQSLMSLHPRESEVSRAGGGTLSDATGMVDDSVLMSIMNDESMMEVSKAD